MKLSLANCKKSLQSLVATATALVTLSISHAVWSTAPAQSPLFLASPVRPLLMLNMSKDHQLFFKLYDDYADLTSPTGGAPDGIPDTTYNNNFNYYGYFDSSKCYVYSTTDLRYNPAGYMTDRYCNSGATGQWSGNFLNWASMTRIDAVRKILYGGKRFIDTEGTTVLERAFLPNDAHSFAKYYGGSDIAQLTPFTANDTDANALNRGITICNTTEPHVRNIWSQEATATNDYPLLRVARGNFSLWASNERWQCRWGVSSNGNAPAKSGIDAYSRSPRFWDVKATDTTPFLPNDKLGRGDYVVRVKVCDASITPVDKNGNEHCASYSSSNYKPEGLLHKYGKTDRIYFGLMTGSYGKNKSGGVLRKRLGSFSDEVNATTGVFITPSSGGGNIVTNLNALRIYGYTFNDGIYHSNDIKEGVYTPDASSDNCPWGASGISKTTGSFTEGRCSNWGNPQTEIYLESLRYLAGMSSPLYNTDDSKYLSGLSRVETWTDPISTAPNGNYCAPLNVWQFNASVSSYDNDSLANASDIGISSLSTWTDLVGSSEGINGNQFFVGEDGVSSNNQLCNAKTVGNLSKVLGICPEAPRLQGGYNMSGLAYKARKEGIASGRNTVKTFGVALAPAVPRVTVSVPGSTAKKVTIMPACREQRTDPETNCAIVDFKIVSQSQSSDGTTNSGSLYINWEDSEQGGDFDQDMWGTLNYSVTATQVTVTTQVFAQSSGGKLGFGYVISGTTSDGFKVQSGINNFEYGSCGTTTGTKCECYTGGSEGACDSTEAVARSQTFYVGSSTAKFLQPPLFYAAKWGGYTDPKDHNLTPAEIAAITNPDTYNYATDPAKLEKAIDTAFGEVAGVEGASATVAANSTRLDTNTYVYQGQFNSNNWSGRLAAFKVNTDGSVDVTSPAWDTDTTLTRTSTRKIYTYDGTTLGLVQLTAANWNSGSLPSLKAALKLASEADYTMADKRFDWLLGSATNEGELRTRTTLMGDIVNSDPAYAGASSQRYENLPGTFGSSSYLAYVTEKKKVDSSGKRLWRSLVFVGANDGMMHAFDAATGEEVFAYIPRGVYGKLASLTDVKYSHQYTVDGPLYVGDVYFDADADGVGGEWRTLVVGSLGAGGRGIYALDITDVLSSATGTPKVIFDASAEYSSVGYKNDLGYMLGKALIAPTQNGNWSIIFGNGTDSVNGYAKLIAVDVENPATYNAIDTGAKSTSGTDNGLAGMALLPDANGVATRAYAGDLLGNMWRFDLSSTSMSSWNVPFIKAGVKKPLITVLDSAGNVQPITSTPTLGLNHLKQVGSGTNAVDSIMVYFGTGKFYNSGDANISQVQSVYAIADTDSALSLTSSNRTNMLLEKKITSESGGVRTVDPDKSTTSGPAVDWKTKDGWFLDLKLFSLSAGLGERVLVKPLLLFDRLIINTFVPSTYQCDYGGKGWLMELVGVGDRYVNHSVLGDMANHQLDNLIMGDLTPILSGEKIILVGSGIARKEGGGATIETLDGSAAGGSKGRMSWRQLK